MATLLLVNGPPAVGKSTLARRYLDDHPLALLVEIDSLRTALGQWAEHEESKQTARVLALALIEAHLRLGFDVVLPQFLGRSELIEALAGIAARHNAHFVEVVLVAEKGEVVRRFRARRDELARSGEPHPEAEVLDADIEVLADEWLARLAEIRGARPGTKTIPVNRGVDEAYASLLAATREWTRRGAPGDRSSRRVPDRAQTGSTAGCSWAARRPSEIEMIRSQ